MYVIEIVGEKKMGDDRDKSERLLWKGESIYKKLEW